MLSGEYISVQFLIKKEWRDRAAALPKGFTHAKLWKNGIEAAEKKLTKPVNEQNNTEPDNK